jgi:hypothetical protein
MQQTDNAKREEQVARRPFVEPEISEGDDILEATSFFQGITGGTDVGGDIN